MLKLDMYLNPVKKLTGVVLQISHMSQVVIPIEISTMYKAAEQVC